VEASTRPFAILAALAVQTALACQAAGAGDRVPPAERGDPPAEGQAVDGLRCSLSSDLKTVPMGATVGFTVALRFDPEGIDPGLDLLNGAPANWRVEFTFTDLRTGKEHRRPPYDPHMPPSPTGPDDLVRLHKKAPRPIASQVHLLSEKGEQLGPGTYGVVAIYENAARDQVEFVRGQDGTLVRRPYSGPLRFWKGKVSSGPLRLEVTPVDARAEVIPMPGSLEVFRTKEPTGQIPGIERFGYRWLFGGDLHTWVRPGSIVGTRHTIHVILDGKAHEVGREIGSVRIDGTTHLLPFLPDDVMERALAGEVLRVAADVEVFATSAPPVHAWEPALGDFEVLWRGKVEGSLRANEKDLPSRPFPGDRRLPSGWGLPRWPPSDSDGSPLWPGKKASERIGQGYRLAQDLLGPAPSRPEPSAVRSTIATLVGLLADHRRLCSGRSRPGMHVPYTYVHVDVDAADALAAIGRPALAALIEAAKSGADDAARALAVLTATKIQERASKEARDLGEEVAKLSGLYLSLIRDPHWQVRQAAAWALSLGGGKENVAAALEAALEDPVAEVRSRAAHALGSRGSGKSVDPLLRALKDPFPSVRSGAARSLGALRAREAVDPLIAALADPDYNVWWAAAKSLGEIGDPKAVEPLLRKMKEENDREDVRAAIEGLGRLKDLRAVEPLIELFDHPNLRFSAWRALQQITGQDLAEEKGAWIRWWQAQKERQPAGPAPK
jgi:HEAT repeat protein